MSTQASGSTRVGGAPACGPVRFYVRATRFGQFPTGAAFAVGHASIPALVGNVQATQCPPGYCRANGNQARERSNGWSND